MAVVGVLILDGRRRWLCFACTRQVTSCGHCFFRRTSVYCSERLGHVASSNSLLFILLYLYNLLSFSNCWLIRICFPLCRRFDTRELSLRRCTQSRTLRLRAPPSPRAWHLHQCISAFGDMQNSLLSSHCLFVFIFLLNHLIFRLVIRPFKLIQVICNYFFSSQPLRRLSDQLITLCLMFWLSFRKYFQSFMLSFIMIYEY